MQIKKRHLLGQRWIAPLVLALTGLGLTSSGGYIYAKAWLAQQLIASAWTRELRGQHPARPWPWADTWPIARLTVPAAEIDLYVLADASGRSLAFGPGWLQSSAKPATDGNTIIAAHRDTHFEFLRHVARGTVLELQLADGSRHRYEIADTFIIDTRVDRLYVETPEPMLTLMTCYPFDALVPGGPLRFVATATPLNKSGETLGTPDD